MKISVIGAGSGIFSLNMIRDFCLTPGLRNSEICFMDISEERLDASCALCGRFIEEMGISLKITKTTVRRECLEGADFVVNTALAEGYHAWSEGWSIAKKRGFRFGGSFHVMHDEAFWINYHQLDMMEDVLKDILSICPNAWYIMVANPVLAGTTYLHRKYPGVRMVGLCHGFRGVFKLAKLIGLDRKDITFQMPGVNHFIWLNSFFYKGKNAFPLIDKWISEKSEDYFADCTYSDYFGPKAVDLYKRYGVFPIGDTSTPGGGAWGSWYHTSAGEEKRWNEDPQRWFGTYFEDSGKTVETIRNAAYDQNVRATDLIPLERSEEPMVTLIESIACDIERIVIVNVPNDGEYVRGIPRDFAVEIPALVSARGIQGIRTIPLPGEILSYTYRDRIAPVEMELMAYEKGRRDLLVDLVQMDPFCRTRAQAEGLVEEILSLPYHEKMNAHYR